MTFNLLHTLQFCKNPSQPLLIHNFVADAVEGSRLRILLRILNQLGCTSSPDTHDRFVTQQADSQRILATCKRAIVETIGLYLLQMGHHLIHNQQRTAHNKWVFSGG